MVVSMIVLSLSYLDAQICNGEKLFVKNLKVKFNIYFTLLKDNLKRNIKFAPYIPMVLLVH